MSGLFLVVLGSAFRYPMGWSNTASPAVATFEELQLTLPPPAREAWGVGYQSFVSCAIFLVVPIGVSFRSVSPGLVPAYFVPAVLLGIFRSSLPFVPVVLLFLFFF